jgi:uncharacterized membrane protein
MNYTYFKLIHLLAVVLFMGNIYTGLFWMNIAVKTRDLNIIAHTMKGIIKADRYFTVPGVIILTAGGFMAAIYGHIPILKTGWIFWSIILFSISGMAFAIKVVPLQKKIYRSALNGTSSTKNDWENIRRAYLEWDIWGLIALITPLAALVMMTLKIPL